MSTIGKLEKILDLRTVWPHETQDFSRWLAQEESLSLLSQSIGIDISLEEIESSVGNFSVDLFASEDGTARKVIIENQLEDTNHDHLGKIITYASGKEAEIIIWIVRHARDEHRQAIEWLNQNTGENICFFLLEIELWRIDNSPPAPKFNIVVRPNDWAKAMRATDGISETKKLQLEFWQAFSEYAFSIPEFCSQFTKRKPAPQHWYSLSTGSSIYHLNLTTNTQKKWIGAEIHIPDNKPLFQKLQSHQQEIQMQSQLKLQWKEASKACRILTVRSGDIKVKTVSWKEYFDWYCQMALKLKEIAKKFDR